MGLSSSSLTAEIGQGEGEELVQHAGEQRAAQGDCAGMERASRGGSEGVVVVGCELMVVGLGGQRQGEVCSGLDASLKGRGHVAAGGGGRNGVKDTESSGWKMQDGHYPGQMLIPGRPGRTIRQAWQRAARPDGQA